MARTRYESYEKVLLLGPKDSPRTTFMVALSSSTPASSTPPPTSGRSSLSGTGTPSTDIPPEGKLPFPRNKIVPLDAKLIDGVTVLLDVEIGLHSQDDGGADTEKNTPKTPPIPAIWLGLNFERKIMEEKKKGDPKERIVRITAETQAIPLDKIKGLVLKVTTDALFTYLLNPTTSEKALLLAAATEQIIEKASIRFGVTNWLTFQLIELATDITGAAPLAELVGASSDFKEIFEDLKK